MGRRVCRRRPGGSDAKIDLAMLGSPAVPDRRGGAGPGHISSFKICESCIETCEACDAECGKYEYVNAERRGSVPAMCRRVAATRGGRGLMVIDRRRMRCQQFNKHKASDHVYHHTGAEYEFHRGRSDLQRGPHLLVKLRVAAAASDRTPLAEVLWSLLERHFTYRLVLDLEGARCLDEAVVSQLMTLAQRIIAHRGTIRLCGLSAYNRRVLEQFETMSELPVYDDIWECFSPSVVRDCRDETSGWSPGESRKSEPSTRLSRSDGMEYFFITKIGDEVVGYIRAITEGPGTLRIMTSRLAVSGATPRFPPVSWATSTTSVAERLLHRGLGTGGRAADVVAGARARAAFGRGAPAGDWHARCSSTRSPRRPVPATAESNVSWSSRQRIARGRDRSHRGLEPRRSSGRAQLVRSGSVSTACAMMPITIAVRPERGQGLGKRAIFPPVPQ